MRFAWPGLFALVAFVAAACGDITELTDVSYDQRFGSATTMDVYLPSGGGTSRPAVLFIHGGGWSGGSKAHFTDLAKQLARSGWVTATINYRLVPDGKFPNAVQDCFCALSFFRAHAGEYGLDPTRVAIMGYSAGGHLVSLMGLAAGDPNLQDAACPSGPTGAPDAVVSGAGPTDLADMRAQVTYDFVGGTPEEVPALYQEASPIDQVHAGAPPYLFIHADDDWFVPISHSRRLRDALRADGNQADLLELAGGGHLLNEGTDLGHSYGMVSTDTPEAHIVLVDFLERTLGAP
jgi:acetyl esterase/lipase